MLSAATRSSTGERPQNGPKNPKKGSVPPYNAAGGLDFSPRSYELQLESRVRRRGLGKFLLQILQLVANR